MNPPNLKKIIVQLENGLVITFIKLGQKKTSEAFKKYPSLFNPFESRTPVNCSLPPIILYRATFNFKRARFQAICFDFSVSLILNMLNNEPEKALNYFEGFIVGETVVPCSGRNATPNDERIQEILRLAVTQNMSPNAVILLQSTINQENTL